MSKKPLAETVGMIEKGPNTLTLIRLITFNGKDAIDIREFFQPAKGPAKGDLCPTQKGVFIPIEHISELVNLIELAEAKYNEITAQQGATGPTEPLL